VTKKVFINLPVRDLPRAMAFYTALGAVNNPHFTDETAACMVVSDAIYVMLLTHAKWAAFTRKPIADPGTSEVMLAITCEDPKAVDAMLRTVAAQGGRADVNAVQDLGFMYSRSFEDPDGHVWEAFHMDMSKVPKNA
jgi:predicted lactoylglutathione lyase